MQPEPKSKMKSTLMKSITRLSIIAGGTALAFTACGDKTGSSESAATDPRIEAVFLDTAPEGAISVLEARKKVEPGAVITVSGRIAGAMEPFSANHATLVLADDTLMTCEKKPGDGCTTPWDACCVASETIAASRLTVQVVGDDGGPVAQTLKKVRGLAELDGLIVTGAVAEGSNERNLILNATGIYPSPKER